MWQDDSDEALMIKIAGGHQLAFERLVQRYAKRAHAVAWRILGNRTEAEDIVQDSFTKIWVNAPMWKGEKAKFSTWFYRILTNACIDVRRKKPMLPIDDEPEMAGSDPSAETVLSQRQHSAQVNRAIAGLPERQRLALTLCYYEEFSNQQAADAMGLHIKALEGLLVRARKTLRETLAPMAKEMKEAI